MSQWYDFDPLDADDRAEQQAVEAEIAAAERSALDAIRQLVSLVDRHGLPAERAGSAALTHISTLAQASGQTVYRRSIDRDELRRQRMHS